MQIHAIEADPIRKQSLDKSFQCFATAIIFERRFAVYQLRLRVLTYLGIVTPAVVGITYVTYGDESTLTLCFVALAGILGTIQLIVSLWAVVARWDEELEYSEESSLENRRLSLIFDTHARMPEVSGAEATVLVGNANRDLESLEARDRLKSVSDGEKRYGYRAALFEKDLVCKCCDKTPSSIEKPSDCKTCGCYRLLPLFTPIGALR
ncbi:mobilome CxxCx(11)CxxC protein [Salinisphaera aquimarina]|uniref:Mobilome CxxCx(11)CxxC protein n=1 Tax=Salinisphaera aquimarina TaxID=2094031 RepID=A0ABV7EHZ4_9GAMM